MSGIIHFGSGKELKITEEQFQKIGPKLRDGGVRVWALKESHIIPLNSHTMEYIERVPEPKVVWTEETHDIPAPKGAIATGTIMPKLDVQVEKPKAKTNEERMAELTEKSNCKHESEKMEMYIQHTAKGYRYFPVCGFCGKRERYVSEKKILDGAYAGTPNEKWTSDDIANAKPWIED